ncbi:hypothetical protein AC578_7812 [Pseudocercospora eumusae]|uniref:Uncharacterized protein n=1 Tax=Pseudocercospora eumusae TaxID=321146 RepID=A0A139GTR8_9PEZI|nr:hypothetical protein AC578_7812 [Pseudocercospora eumusae]
MLCSLYEQRQHMNRRQILRPYTKKLFTCEGDDIQSQQCQPRGAELATDLSGSSQWNVTAPNVSSFGYQLDHTAKDIAPANFTLPYMFGDSASIFGLDVPIPSRTRIQLVADGSDADCYCYC